MLSLYTGAGLLTLLWQEKHHPLRWPSVENKFRHDFRNLGIGLVSALTIALTEKPLTNSLTRLMRDYRIGLIPSLRLSPAKERILSLILLDYTLYLWHVLTHKNKFLWRFHEVHHEDLDLTATTAIRFHFAEMAISSLWRGAQVLLIGVNERNLKLWQQLTLMEILFHHSNIKLPLLLERMISKIFVTPRMHAIHHSINKKETFSNWSSGLTVWDWLHGTLNLNVPQKSIRIGVPAYREREDVEFFRLMKKPFLEQRETWS